MSAGRETPDALVPGPWSLEKLPNACHRDPNKTATSTETDHLVNIAEGPRRCPRKRQVRFVRRRAARGGGLLAGVLLMEAS
jgi:hypothetical protein